MKAAVLGCGGMGRNLISPLLACPELSEVVVYDPDQSARRRMTEQYGVFEAKLAEDVWRDPKIGVVFIATPTFTHAELALTAMRHGKAVLLEKPVATTLETAELVVAEAERLKAFLQIGFELRYSRLYEMAKEAIDAGHLGKVVSIHANYICSEFYKRTSWKSRLNAGGGMFGEKLSHYVDLPRWLTGSEFEEIHAVCAPNVVSYFEVPDNYQCVYRMKDGSTGHLTFFMYVASSFQGDPLQNVTSQQRDDGHELRHLITGKRGAIELDVFRRRYRRWVFDETAEGHISKMVEEETWPEGSDHRYFHDTTSQTQDIVRRVARGLPPKTSAADALATMRVVEAAERSAAEGRCVKLSEVCPSPALAERE